MERSSQLCKPSGMWYLVFASIKNNTAVHLQNFSWSASLCMTYWMSTIKFPFCFYCFAGRTLNWAFNSSKVVQLYTVTVLTAPMFPIVVDKKIPFTSVCLCLLFMAVWTGSQIMSSPSCYSFLGIFFTVFWLRQGSAVVSRQYKSESQYRELEMYLQSSLTSH